MHETTERVEIPPYHPGGSLVVRVEGRRYRPGRYLILENRRRVGFDADLPGEGLLVWRVDEGGDQDSSTRPGLYLVQADGRGDMDLAKDQNDGDAGDPFPGATGKRQVLSRGTISTSFPDGPSSGISMKNIEVQDGGKIVLDVHYAAGA